MQRNDCIFNELCVPVAASTRAIYSYANSSSLTLSKSRKNLWYRKLSLMDNFEATDDRWPAGTGLVLALSEECTIFVVGCPHQDITRRKIKVDTHSLDSNARFLLSSEYWLAIQWYHHPSLMYPSKLVAPMTQRHSRTSRGHIVQSFLLLK
jgi:hypothetical protein